MIQINSTRKVIFITIVWMVTSGFSLFSYGPPETHTRLVEYNNWGKPDSHKFVVLAYHKKYRWPTGIINSFPDGSNLKTLKHWISIYVCDADTRTSKNRGEIIISENYRLNTVISLSPLWLDDTFFITVKGHEDSLNNNLWGTRISSEKNSMIYSISLDGLIRKVDFIPDAAKQHVSLSERRKSDYQTDYSRRFVWIAVDWSRVAVETDKSPRKGDRLSSEVMFLLDKEDGELKTNPEIVLMR